MKLLDNLGKAIANLPFVKRAALAPRYEPPNVSSSATVSSVQAMIRGAENGDTRNLFSYYRDLIISSSHVQSEFSKRKLALLGDSMAILPADKNKPDDVTAAEACRAAIEDCENWMDGLTFLLDSSLYPVSVVEHLFRAPNPATDPARTVALRYTLKRLEPVNYALLCFRNDYPRTGQSYITPQKNTEANTPVPDVWEPDLRFYSTDANGNLVYDWQKTYPADPLRHMVHRGHLLVGVRDNWGGPMRAIVFWDLLAKLGRDWFGRFMERFGNPFIVGRTDSANAQAVSFLQEALSLSTKIGGLVVDHETQIELKEAMISGGADGYEKFLGVCNREISKVIVGQDLSAQSSPTGLGSGVANLQAGVRQDIRMFDQLKLAETIQKQLFVRFLKVNGLRGAAPKVRWGGLSPEEAEKTGALLVSLANAGLQPTDESIELISERVGFDVERKAAPEPSMFGNGFPSPTSRPSRETDLETFRANLPQTLRARLATLQAQNKMADNLGVPVEWLNPLRDFLTELEAKVSDATLTQADLFDFLDRAVARVPELFADMDVDELARVLEAGMGNAVISEVRKGLKQGKE